MRFWVEMSFPRRKGGMEVGAIARIAVSYYNCAQVSRWKSGACIAYPALEEDLENLPAEDLAAPGRRKTGH